MSEFGLLAACFKKRAEINTYHNHIKEFIDVFVSTLESTDSANCMIWEKNEKCEVFSNRAPVDWVHGNLTDVERIFFTYFSTVPVVIISLKLFVEDEKMYFFNGYILYIWNNANIRVGALDTFPHIILLCYTLSYEYVKFRANLLAYNTKNACLTWPCFGEIHYQEKGACMYECQPTNLCQIL